MTKYLNFNSVMLDNSPVATHIANCVKCTRNPVIRELALSFFTLLFAPIDAEYLEFDQEKMIRHVQLVIADITKECTK